jgi:hypothetical protein
VALDGQIAPCFAVRVTISNTFPAGLDPDPGFLAAVDAQVQAINLQFAMMYGAMQAMAAQAQRPTAASARAVRHAAHASGLPVGGAR